MLYTKIYNVSNFPSWGKNFEGLKDVEFWNNVKKAAGAVLLIRD